MLSLLGPGVQSLIRELRSCKLSCTAKKKKKDKLIEKESTIEVTRGWGGGVWSTEELLFNEYGVPV